MKELRPYQAEGKGTIYNAWTNGASNVLYVLPTGGGKAVLLSRIAIEHGYAKRSKPTTIVVHRKELVQQLSLTLAGEGAIHNIIAPRAVILQIIAAQRKIHRKQFYDPKAPISVISVDTLNARASKYKEWAKGIHLWITDEAHHLLKGNKWGKAVELFPNAKGLGVTATPERLDRKGLGSHADGYFDVMVEGPDTKWLIDNKYLSPWKAVVPSSDYEQFLKDPKDRDYTTKEMEEAAEKSKIIGDVVENYMKWALGKQAILFAPTVKVGEQMESEFLQAGIRAKLLTGNTPPPERLEGVLDFKSGELQVLLNVDLFDEGFDVAGVEVVIHARPTMSKSKYKQMNGRGLRIKEGKTHALIIDHVGNIRKHGRPDKKERWTLDRIKKRRTILNSLRFCTSPMCMAPYERELKECPFCKTSAIVLNREPGERTPPEMVDGDLVLLDPLTLEELERATILEEPERVGERVARVAGTPAGIRAMKNQEERIKTQEVLKYSIAQWAGEQTWRGLEDREIHKLFYITYGTTIVEALAEPRAGMLGLIERLRDERG